MAADRSKAKAHFFKFNGRWWCARKGNFRFEIYQGERHMTYAHEHYTAADTWQKALEVWMRREHTRDLMILKAIDDVRLFS